MKFKRGLKRTILWLIVLSVAIVPIQSFALEVPYTQARDQTIRVRLTRLGLTDRLDVTLTAPYQLETGNGTKIYIPEGSELVFQLKNNSIYLHYRGLSQIAGTSIHMRRAGAAMDGFSGGFYRTHFPALYLGDLSLTIAEGKLLPVLSIHVEDYLLGVVPYEMDNAFPLEALKAQAIAARTYAIRNQNQYDGYDVVDNTNDQVFHGYLSGKERAEKAIQETRGICGFYKGKLAQCYYSASNGGQTELVQTVWPTDEDFGYYAFGEDPYDVQNPQSTVRHLDLSKKYQEDENAPYVVRKLIAETMGEKLAESGYDVSPESIRVDAVKNVVVDSPNMQGSKKMTMLHLEFAISVRRLQQTLIQMVDSDVEEVSLFEVIEPEEMPSAPPAATFVPLVTTEPAASPELVYTAFEPWQEPVLIDLPIFPDAEKAFALSISSNYHNEIWSVVETEDEFRIEVRRYGHGVGMSQRGAQVMAEKYGKDYQEILGFYYPKMDLLRYPEQEITYAVPESALAESPGPAPSPTPRPTPMPLSLVPEIGQWIAVVTEIADNSSLNLRSEPNLSSKILMRIYKGQRLLIVERCPEEGWVRVRTDTAEGYVMESYLSIERE